MMIWIKGEGRGGGGGGGVKQGVGDIISFPHCRRQNVDETMKEWKKAELSISPSRFFHLTKLQWGTLTDASLCQFQNHEPAQRRPRPERKNSKGFERGGGSLQQTKPGSGSVKVLETNEEMFRRRTFSFTFYKRDSKRKECFQHILEKSRGSSLFVKNKKRLSCDRSLLTAKCRSSFSRIAWLITCTCLTVGGGGGGNRTHRFNICRSFFQKYYFLKFISWDGNLLKLQSTQSQLWVSYS